MAGRRLLSTAAASSGNTEFPVPIARLRSLAREGRLADIDDALALLIPSHPAAAVSALSVVGLPDRASAIPSKTPSPTAARLNALLGPLLRRRNLATLVPGFLNAHPSVPRDAVTSSIIAKSLCLTSGADAALHLVRGEEPPSLQLYTSIIDSYYKQKKPHRAMVEDHGIAPDATAYNVKNSCKSTNGTVEEVKELIRVIRIPHSCRYTNFLRPHALTSRGIPVNFHQLICNAVMHSSHSRATANFGISTTRNLLAADNAMVPISSPLTPPPLDAEETDKNGAVVKQLKVQAIKKDIKQSPKKVNLVAKLVRGMRVEDALLQLQVTVKRAAKTLYQVIHSSRANASHNHGLDPDKLIVEEAFVGKGLHLKRLSYHAKGRCGVMVRPRCRLTVVVREATAEEEAKIAKLRVSNYKKLTRKEKQLMPHRLIEVSPRWARKRKEEAGVAA